MIRLMNSAMIPTPGTYKLEEISKTDFFTELERADQFGFKSYVGYQSTIDYIHENCSVNVPISREETEMEDGDRILIIKLRYRATYGAKAKEAPKNDGDFAFFKASYSK